MDMKEDLRYVSRSSSHACLPAARNSLKSPSSKMSPPLSTTTTLKRIHREIADLKKEDLGAISLAPSDDNLFTWTATIPGPEGSCYEGGLFHVDINLAHDYPFSAPKVTFRTRIYHMNINDRGNICIDILKHNWSPALSLFKVILSLSSLLTDPNPKDPLVPSIATQYVRNRSQHDRTARHWTELYAHPPPPGPATTAEGAAVPGGRSKGKNRANHTPASVASTTRPVSASGSARAETITILDDSDEGASSGTAGEGRAPRTRSGTKRKRGAEGTDAASVGLVINVDEPARPTRKRRGVASDGSSRAGQSSREDDDVIVIED
ncbi:hypothetical protein AcW1_010233 [Taiwanofungus camphoratus]|nr:hypothetical protein AcW1_010233 [Antrodia cinnamomea]